MHKHMLQYLGGDSKESESHYICRECLKNIDVLYYHNIFSKEFHILHVESVNQEYARI
jgi:hypothetical protein